MVEHGKTDTGQWRALWKYEYLIGNTGCLIK